MPITTESGIYQIRSLCDGKLYIGSASNLAKRVSGHKWSLRLGTHYNKHLQAAWIKHGKDNFVFEMVLVCNKSDLVFYEQRVIDINNTTDRSRGYNLRKIAESNRGVKRPGLGKFMARLHKGNKYRVGKTHTPESIALMSQNRKGKGVGTRSPDVGKKISERLRGHRHSEETKRKLALARAQHNNRWLTYNGETLRFKAMADKYGIDRLLLFSRLRNEWPIDRALLEPANSKRFFLLTHNGETLCLKDMSKKYGVKRTTVSARLRRGWPIEKALLAPVE